MKCYEVILIVLLHSVALSIGKEIHVSTTGSNSNDCGALDKPCLTLQRAIAIFTSDDVILVHEGTYRGQGNAEIALVDDSHLYIKSVSGSERTIIDLEGQQLFNNAINDKIAVEGVTITGGFTEANGGAIFSLGGDLNLTDVHFIGNTAGGFGSAIAVTGPAVVTMENCHFSNNSAEAGAMYFNSAVNVTWNHGTAKYNTAGRRGDGAVILAEDESRIVANNVHFLFNAAQRQAGVVQMTYLCRGVWTDCVFKHNTARSDGGVFIHRRSTSRCTRCTFDSNFSRGYGGVGTFQIGSGLRLIDSTVENNVATLGGGAVHVENLARLVLNNTDVTNNRASRGGAFLVQTEAKVFVINSRIKNNNSSTGGCAYIQYQGEIDFIDSTVEDNIATDQGSAIFCSDSKVNVTSSNFDGNIVDGVPSETPKQSIYCSETPPYTYCKTYGDWTGYCKENTHEDSGASLFGNKGMVIVVIIVPTFGILACLGCTVITLWVFKTRKPKYSPLWAQKLLVTHDEDEDEGEELRE